MFLGTRSRDEEGQALVMVIGMMLIMGILLMIMISSAVFGVGFTSQTRASVQSRAAAEAGIDAAAVKIMNGECATFADSAGNFDQTAGVPAFAGKVYRQATEAAAFAAGCPLESDHAFRVVSTGYAQLEGGLGFDNGDSETLEGLWIRPEQPPRFDEAIRGDTGIYFNSNTIVVAPQVDGDLYTRGDVTCASGMRVEGTVVAEGNMTWTGSNCIVKGDVYVQKNLVYPVAPYGTPSVGGNVVVLGNIASYASQASPNFQQVNAGQYINVAGTVKAGGLIHAYCSYAGHATNTNWTGFNGYVGPGQCPGGGTKVTMRVPGLTMPEPAAFERFDKASEPWASWTTKNWKDAASHPGNTTNSGTCGSATSGGATMNITTNTRIDTTTACANGLILGDWGGLTINLSADLVVYVNKLSQNGNVKITSADGNMHSIFFVVPAPAAFTKCPNPGSTIADKITFSSGTWDQTAKSAVMFYTTEKINVGRSNFKLGGQLYSCYTQMQDGLELIFRRAGEQTSSSGFEAFDVSYIRRG